jgi:hypothetical protein|tara:strand:- start:2692 stop:3426 length:735 start_codon:yes stop_codon:yes gene_type:complete
MMSAVLVKDDTKIKRIVAFGDSFVSGYVEKGDNESATFVELLGHKLKVKTINRGWKGHSDFSISYDIFNFFRDHPDLIEGSLFLISFSGWRRGYKIKESEMDVSDFAMFGGVRDDLKYSAEMGLPMVHRHQVELSQNALVTLFESNNVPFLFTNSFQDLKKVEYSFELPFEYYVEGDKKNNTLLDILKGTWLKGDDDAIKRNSPRNSFQVKKKWGSMTHDCGHPTKKGHERIAKTLKPYIECII